MKSFFQRVGDWFASLRLPVRIPVPNRDNLIAMSLMALSVGLVVGVAIGPALGAANNAIAGIIAPAATAPTESPATDDTITTDTSDDVTLGAPSGGVTPVSTNVSDSTPPADTSTDPGTDYIDTSGSDEPTDQINQAPKDKADDKADPDPDPEPVGSELVGIVVGVEPSESGYDIADSSGNVLALHPSKAPPPAVGSKVTTLINGLSNGTFDETGDPAIDGTKLKSKLRGVATWIDPVNQIVVMSSRGSSLPVGYGAIPLDEGKKIQIGSYIEATVVFSDPVEADEALGTQPVPGLTAEEMAVDDEPSDRIELSGKVKSVDEEARLLTIAADSNGLLPADIVVAAPTDLDLGKIILKRVYNLSADVADDGLLTISGLSPDYSVKSADDASLAFGGQA